MSIGKIVFYSIVVCVIFLVVDYLRTRNETRKAKLIEFPKEWLLYLKQNVPIYNRLPDYLKMQLQHRVRVFIEEKAFEACGGLDEVTEEMQVTIAGHACLLLLNKDRPYYLLLGTVIVYPEDYWAGDDGSGFVDEVRSGESWREGTVVLAWDEVKRSARDVRDGKNLAIHEFAHQIDEEGGDSEGLPKLEKRSAYPAWARVFSEQFDDLKGMIERGEDADLDEYGAESPAEFFAVATESFFEKPERLRSTRPKLYEQLRFFYKVDPVKWAKA
ncbi:MAG: zinc-dependent peptidase [Verrucomicrobiales bacterium]|nr:zinc-dependent peptidase [Verrucomicrobiales bacterium]